MYKIAIYRSLTIILIVLQLTHYTCINSAQLSFHLAPSEVFALDFALAAVSRVFDYVHRRYTV